MKLIQTSRDALWKVIIEKFFPAFLEFFFPEYIQMLDLDKGFDFLDKELVEIRPKSKGNQRYMDKLAKVYTHEGNEEWVSIHLEVQGYYDLTFEERMFIYYYRGFDKFQKRITALAILTNDESDHPTQYHTSFMGTELTYKFNTYKLAEKTPEDFADTDNPFAIIMEVAWYALKKNKPNDDELYSFKIRLVRRLKELNYDTEHIRVLFGFIKKYVNFEKPEINLKFEEETNIILGNELTMDIAEVIIQDAKRQGIEEAEQRLNHKIEETKQELTHKFEEDKQELTHKFEEDKQELTHKFEQSQKQTALNLQKKGFSNIEISEVLNISLDELLYLIEKK